MNNYAPRESDRLGLRVGARRRPQATGWDLVAQNIEEVSNTAAGCCRPPS
jgi:hypothetical protein